MICIVSGTNRPGSRTLGISLMIQSMLSAKGESAEVLDLQELPYHEMTGAHYWGTQPDRLSRAVDKVTQAEGLIMVVPEYNGSYPGALKYFIDHWRFPDSFESRPVAFIGLGGRFGGLRPVEHLQQVFGYRNAYIFPQRVFLSNVQNTFKEGILNDAVALELLERQVSDFSKFVTALKSQGLDANSLLRKKPG